jgi:hypothetical protein
LHAPHFFCKTSALGASLSREIWRRVCPHSPALSFVEGKPRTMRSREVDARTDPMGDTVFRSAHFTPEKTGFAGTELSMKDTSVGPPVLR